MRICSCKNGFAAISKHLRPFVDICSSYLSLFVVICNRLPLFICERFTAICCFLLVYLHLFAIITICSEQSFATICTHGLGGSKVRERWPGMGKGIGQTKGKTAANQTVSQPTASQPTSKPASQPTPTHPNSPHTYRTHTHSRMDSRSAGSLYMYLCFFCRDRLGDSLSDCRYFRGSIRTPAMRNIDFMW